MSGKTKKTSSDSKITKEDKKTAKVRAAKHKGCANGKAKSESEDLMGSELSNKSGEENTIEEGAGEEGNENQVYQPEDGIEEEEEGLPEGLDAEGPAAINWDTVEYVARVKIPFSELVKLTDGELELSLLNKRLKYGKRTRVGDFSMKNKDGNHDIVKSIDCLHYTCNTTDLFIIGVPSVPAFMSEGFYEDTGHVNQYVLPFQLSSSEPRDVNVLNRNITNSVIDFQNRFPGLTLSNFKKHIQYVNENNTYVHTDSPMVGLINEHLEAKGKNLLVASVEQKNQVLVPTKMAKKFEKKTMDLMKEVISYANITGNYTMKMHRPIPDECLAQHKKYVKSGGTDGKPYLGFAEGMPVDQFIKGLSASQASDLANVAKDAMLIMNFVCRIQYKHITGEKIELNSK